MTTSRALKQLDGELTTFLDRLTAGMGRPERRSAMAQYVTGLLLDGERKSIEPIAARLVDYPAEVQAMRQRLQPCVVVSPWAAETIFARLARTLARLARTLDRDLPGVTAFVVDDTGFPKKGRHSVGVARQYSGTLGARRTVRSQPVSISRASAAASAYACISPRRGPRIGPRYTGGAAPPSTRHVARGLPLVRLAKLRWRIERDYQEMKGELGLDHFEGRTWQGFHHHIALCAAAHAFLALRRALFPPAAHPVDPRPRAAASPAAALA